MSKLDVNSEVQEDQKELETAKKAKRKSPLELRRYTKQIWLAGLGAFSRAEDEGNRLFESLVKVGEELEGKTNEIADNTVGKVTEVKDKAINHVTGTVDKVEKIIDQQAHQTLNRIGLATPRDIARLEQLLLQMDEKLEQMYALQLQMSQQVTQLKQKYSEKTTTA